MKVVRHRRRSQHRAEVAAYAALLGAVIAVTVVAHVFGLV